MVGVSFNAQLTACGLYQGEGKRLLYNAQSTVSYIRGGRGGGQKETETDRETERKRRVDKTPSQPAYISAIERGRHIGLILTSLHHGIRN